MDKVWSHCFSNEKEKDRAEFFLLKQSKNTEIEEKDLKSIQNEIMRLKKIGMALLKEL